MSLELLMVDFCSAGPYCVHILTVFIAALPTLVGEHTSPTTVFSIYCLHGYCPATTEALQDGAPKKFVCGSDDVDITNDSVKIRDGE